MSIWNKLFALFRGTVHEGAQGVVDANALRILDQEIRDADAAQGKARDDMAGLVARRRMLETEVSSYGEQIRKYEASARAALAKGDEALAREVAQRIADLERDANQKQTQAGELRTAEDRLRQVVAQTDQRIESLRREIEVVRVNVSVQRAQSSVVAQTAGAGSNLGSAAESLKRIKERQAINEEKFRAAGELEDRRTGADLDAKLRNAGILPGETSADDVLARLTGGSSTSSGQTALPRASQTAIPMTAPPLQLGSPEGSPVRREDS